MKIGVIGGTGRIGAKLCERASAAGHAVIAVSRHGSRPTVGGATLEVEARCGDITSRQDMLALAEDCDIIFELTDSPMATKRLTAGARNLVETANAAQQPPILVCLGIINAEDSGFGYHRAKAAQVEIYSQYERSHILRASQFFSFLNMIFDGGAAFGCIPCPAGTSFQPVSESDVAAELLRAVEGEAPKQWCLTGPELLTCRAAAERYRSAQRRRRLILPVWLPGALGRFLRAGGNIDTSAPKAPTAYAGEVG